jgi:hypothetical protein
MLDQTDYGAMDTMNQRYGPMKKLSMLVISVTLTLGTTVAARAQHVVSEIPFESIANPLNLRMDLYLGEAAGVALNSKGHLYDPIRREMCAKLCKVPK